MIGASKTVAQTTKTSVESTIAINTFLKSIYFFSFFELGAGSNPLFPPKILMGWHLRILFIPSNRPLNIPLNFKESIKYSEQVGRYLQFDGK
jgi:hypothetical protein